MKTTWKRWRTAVAALLVLSLCIPWSNVWALDSTETPETVIQEGISVEEKAFIEEPASIEESVFQPVHENGEALTFEEDANQNASTSNSEDDPASNTSDISEDSDAEKTVISETSESTESTKTSEASVSTPDEPEAVTYSNSGRTSIAKPTMAQLKSWMAAIPEVTSIYATTPIVSGSNYRVGTYTTAAKNNIVGWINYYRQAAGLSKISVTDTLNTSAGYGALVLAMLNSGLTHTPPKPDDMSQADYEKAYYSTSHSNISYSMGYPVGKVLQVAVSGQMEDDDAGNISRVGHRRWLLNPNVKTMGVGTANNTKDTGYGTYATYYTDIRVFGDNVSTSTVNDYDFISWPASGNNLSETFPNTTPWSVSFNTTKYAYPDASKVKVVLTRLKDGKKWTFSSSTDNSNFGPSYDFFTVNNAGYGLNNCIIFRPSYSDFDVYSGEYTVDITGISTASGAATSLHYKAVFDAQSSHAHDWQLTGWTWSADNSSATANFVCTKDSSHTTSVKATVKKEVVSKPTCTSYGTTKYTATATLEGRTYTYTKSVMTDPLGHNWSTTFTWSGLTSAKATRICKNDKSHKETVTCSITSQVTVQPTDNAAGKRVYTATARFSDWTTATDTKEEMLPGLLWKWKRLAGDTRYTTMAAITQEGFQNGNCSTLILATGASFPDALSGSALAGVYDCPIILTKKSALSTEAKSEIQRLASAEGCKVLILGGIGVIPAAIENEVLKIGSHITTERIAGADRYETAIKVYEKILEAKETENPVDPEPVIDTVILASGAGYADALAISPYAYASGTPILLVKKDGSLKDEVKALIEEAGFSYAIILGGTSAVSAETESWLLNADISVLRLAGDDRYLTCAEIIRWEMGLLPDALLQPTVSMKVDGMGAASGKNFPDALASVSLLGKTESPLLLLPGSKSAKIQGIVDELVAPHAKEIQKGYVFGGAAAVADPLWEMLNLATVE